MDSCSRDRVAYKKLSDGTPMRQRHRIGNAKVDEMAKQAAEDEKLPFCTLRWIESQSVKLRDISMWIGRITVYANHYCLQNGEPGTKFRPIRDSEGLAASRQRKAKAGRKRKNEFGEDSSHRRLGDLSHWPRWQQLRIRILAREALAAAPKGELC